MATEINNTKVKDISVSNAPHGQYILTVVQESPFAGFGDAGVEYVMTLFSKRDQKVDEATVERTQNELRKQLDDENIIFTDPQDATDDENHIENWVPAHIGATVGLITQNNDFFNLGEGLTGGGSFGDSNFLSGYKASDGSYDPTQHRVPFFDALTPKQQDAVRTKDVQKYPELQSNARSNYVGLNIQGIVVDAILSSTNEFGSTPSSYTREEVRNEVIDSLTAGKSPNEENQAIAKRIEDLPDNFAYVDLLTELGGSSAENVQGTKKGLINGLLNEVGRTSVRFYVQNPETGYIFQSTSFKAGGTAQTLASQNNVQFEFLTGDFVESDLVRFLSSIAGVQGTEFDIASIFQVTTDKGLFDQDKGTFNIESMKDLLDVLRGLFVGRKVDIQSTLRNNRGDRDLDKLGTNVRGVSLETFDDLIQTDLIAAGPAVSAPAAADEEPSATPGNPFASVEQEDEETDAPSNPFGAVEEEADDAPEEKEDVADEKEETDLTNNPFT